MKGKNKDNLQPDPRALPLLFVDLRMKSYAMIELIAKANFKHFIPKVAHEVLISTGDD